MNKLFIKSSLCIKTSYVEGRIDMKDPNWVVRSVQAKNDYTLILSFADGSTKIYDARPLLEKNIYTKLNNPIFFSKAKVECGTVVLNDDIDISPEHLYEFSTPLNEN